MPTPTFPLGRLARRAALLAAALALIGLSGCSVLCQLCKDPSIPSVSVEGGQVRVNPDPLVFKPSDGAVTIRWRLPANGPFEFDEKLGIQIEDLARDQAVKFDGARQAYERNPKGESPPAAQVFSCQRSPEVPHEFTCLNRNKPGGVYKYTINVRDRALQRSLRPFDPVIVNEWNN